MAIKYITIGSAVDVFGYDSADAAVGMAMEDPIKIGAPLATDHAARSGETEAEFNLVIEDINDHMENFNNPHKVTSANLVTGAPKSATLNFGGGVAGQVASLTFENGILTAYTLVP